MSKLAGKIALITGGNSWIGLATAKAFVRKRVPLTSILLVAVAVSWAAQAEELFEIQAKSLRLGDVSGVAYYTVQGQSYRLVVTLAGQDSSAVRFVSTLLPGQKVSVSMSGSATADARTIEFTREEDRLLVTTTPKAID